MTKPVFIRDVAAAAGMRPEAVRYYERLKMLEPDGRTAAGYRVYSPEAIERIRFIKRAQRLGLTLDEIREVLRLKYSGQSPCACVRAILKRKLVELERQMAEMEEVRREIERSLRKFHTLARLPHEASAICPIIQAEKIVPLKSKNQKGAEEL
jgi:MerR family copper efflux transcriptional regulator